MRYPCNAVSQTAQRAAGGNSRQREFFLDNLLVRIHLIMEVIRWTGIAPWKFEFYSSGSLASSFLCHSRHLAGLPFALALCTRLGMKTLIFYCQTTSARTSPRTPRRTCCPHAYALITVRVSRSCEKAFVSLGMTIMHV